METDGMVWHARLDNHVIATVFEELVRRVNKKRASTSPRATPQR